MRNADGLGDAFRIEDVLSGAAGFFALYRFAVIVKLQGHADDVITFFGQKSGRDGTVDAARHGDDHAGIRRILGKAQCV